MQKISAAKHRHILRNYRQGIDKKLIAKAYMVGRTTVYRVLWAEFGKPLPKRTSTGKGKSMKEFEVTHRAKWVKRAHPLGH